MLLGKWKNFEELEDCLSLGEINLLVKAEREKDARAKKFAAALKGINLEDDAKDKFEEIKKRADEKIAAMYGTKTETTEEDEFAALGIKMRKD